MPHSSARLQSYVCLIVLSLLVTATAALAGDFDNGKSKTPASQQKARSIEPTYRVQAGVDSEIFPAMANYASLQRAEERNWATLTVTIANPTDAPLRNRVAVQVPGWSDQEIQTIEISAGAARTLMFAPTFLPRLYSNREIVAATASVQVSDASGRVVFATTVPVRLRAAEDMYWGKDFKFAPFIASWVTPHDTRVQQVLGLAKEFAPNRRLPGYEAWKSAALQEQSTYAQAKAIYRALQAKRVSYVKSSVTFGRNASVSERVRLPRESLRDVSANCIDGAVMYASLFENLGMEPTVVLVPGHAYVGVRLATNSNQYLYIETSLTGRATFAAAVAAAERGLARYRPSEITRIEVEKARVAGIYPMPAPTRRQRAGLEGQPAGAQPAATRSR